MKTQTTKKKGWWILRDLSNGDGADGRAYPTYVWAFPTRAQARRAARMHRLPKFARLGPIERWPRATVRRLYTGGDVGTVSEFYYRRKDRRLIAKVLGS